jgi:hypothetical protein
MASFAAERLGIVENAFAFDDEPSGSIWPSALWPPISSGSTGNTRWITGTITARTILPGITAPAIIIMREPGDAHQRIRLSLRAPPSAVVMVMIVA